MRLIIAEKPKMAEAIAKALGANKFIKIAESSKGLVGYREGNGYCIASNIGHVYKLKDVFEYEEYSSYGKDWSKYKLPIVPKNFEYKEAPEMKDKIKVIRELLKRKDLIEVIHAGDPDREGQVLIQNTLIQLKNTKPVKRLILPDLTEKTILSQINKMKDNKEYELWYQEGIGRIYVDWLLGINITIFLSLKLKKLIRTGRVKYPTMKFIYDREMEIRNFKSEIYFSLENKNKVDLILKEKFKLEEEARRKGEFLNKQIAKVIKIEEKNVLKLANKLFSLSTITKYLDKRYQWSANQTYKIVDSLYQKGLTTYPRTDVEYLTTNEKSKVKEILSILNDSNLEFKDKSSIFNDKKMVGDGHSAIIPTGKKNELLSEDEKLVYDIILKRFKANFTKEDRIVSTTTMYIKVGDEVFTKKGEVLKQQGWGIYEEDKLTDNLPDLKLNEEFKVNFLPEKKNTTPPSKINETILINWFKNPFKGNLEDIEENEANKITEDEEDDLEAIREGSQIGTKATRALILEDLLKEKYLKKEKRNYEITDLGIAYVEAHIKLNVDLDKDRTVKITKDLNKISEGKLKVNDLIVPIEKELNKMINSNIEINEFNNEKENFGLCPKCKKHHILYSKKGYYYCSDYTNCKFIFSNKLKALGNEIEINDSKAKTLILGKSILISKLKNKEGKTYDAYFKLEINNNFGNLKLDKFKDNKK